MRNVVVLNGPNLNLLGTREPEVYGRTTLADLRSRIIEWGTDHGLSVETFQSNHEGELIDRIHQAARYADGVVLNAGALTHYSYALHDAIRGVGIPTVEVHISNIHTREEWRRKSVIEAACVYSIFGRGIKGYRDALAHLRWLSASPPTTLSYGTSPDLVADLRLPDGEPPYPVAVTIHGDLWRDVTTRDLMDGIAVDLQRRGWASWNIEYHRVGGGGGYSRTLEDVAAAIDALTDVAAHHSIDLDRVVTIGHSAGGHLALWAAARAGLPSNAPGATPKVRLHAAVALAPIADLAEAHRRGTGHDAVEAFMRRSPQNAPGRYSLSNPAQLLPLGIEQIIVQPASDEVVAADMSAAYAAAASTAGDPVTYVEIDGAGHDAPLDPEGAAWAAAASRIDRLR